MLVIGKPEAVAAMRQQVQKLSGIAGSLQRCQPASGQPLCDICEEPLNKERTLQTCGHRFCEECITPMFKSAADSETQFPLTCPSLSGCGKEVCWRDLVSLTQPADLDRIMLQAFAHRVMTGPFQQCWAPDCEGLRYTGPGASGTDWHCELCMQHYCPQCSDELREPVPLHHTLSCQQYQQAAKDCKASGTFDVLTMWEKIRPCPSGYPAIEMATIDLSATSWPECRTETCCSLAGLTKLLCFSASHVHISLLTSTCIACPCL